MSYVRTPEHREMMRRIKTGQKHGEETRKLISQNHHDVSGRRNPMFGRRGELHPSWRGGISKENDILRKSLEFRYWRSAVFKRDGYACRLCGRAGYGDLNADHIKPWSLYPKLRFDLNNGRTLCRSCHRETETYAGKMNRKEFREHA